MCRIRQALIVAAAAAGIAAWSTSASALQIIRSESFAFGGSVLASFGFREFDPSLGTLDRVDISITGMFASTVFVPPGTLLPIVTLTLSNGGPRGFSFNGDALLTLDPLVDPGPPSSQGHLGLVSTFFTIGLAFTSQSDLVGFSPVTVTSTNGGVVPPSGTSDKRSDFEALQPIGFIGIFENMQLSPLTFPTGSFLGNGSVLVTYIYTPAATSIPAPPAGVLFALGLILAVRRRAQLPG
jgi:hypothetical protein